MSASHPFRHSAEIVPDREALFLYFEREKLPGTFVRLRIVSSTDTRFSRSSTETKQRIVSC